MPICGNGVSFVVTASRHHIVNRLAVRTAGRYQLGHTGIAGEVECPVTADRVLHDLDRSLFGVGRRTGGGLARRYGDRSDGTVVTSKAVQIPARGNGLADVVTASGHEIVNRLAVRTAGRYQLGHTGIAGEVECPVTADRVLHDLDRSLFGVGCRTGRGLAGQHCDRRGCAVIAGEAVQIPTRGNGLADVVTASGHHIVDRLAVRTDRKSVV